MKKNLDQAGDRRAQDFSRVLRDRLDELVPSYKDAPGVASKFFDARDALEAGEKAVLWKGDPDIVRQQVAKMSANEQTLFREGHALSLAQKMENLADRTNVTNQIFQSPQARKMIDAVSAELERTRSRRTSVARISWTRSRRRSATRRRPGN